MEDIVVSLGRDSLRVAAQLLGPPLLIGALAGLLVGIIQTAIQIQDQTISFVVKLASLLAATAALLPWGMTKLADFTRSILESSSGAFN